MIEEQSNHQSRGVEINYHPQSGWFDHAPQRGAFLVKSPLKRAITEDAPQGAQGT
jgi:hypothetical protein